MTLLLLALGAAHAGYADVDEEGYPHWEERELHIYTNLARVAVEDFESDYRNGGCSFDDFSSDEQTPKPPLYLDRGLNEAAVYHSQDMYETGNFSHSSSDGTSFQQRVARYYSDSGYVGENIAWGYGSAYNAIFTGWMCSTEGHRANIMSGDYNELGTGMVNDYATQDFGAGTVQVDSPVAMGIHVPQTPTDTVDFLVDWQDDEAPVTFDVVLDGQAIGLELQWGEQTQGMFSAESAVEDPDLCHEYYVRWARADGSAGTFPETGSYLFGGACTESVDWVERQMCITGENCRSLEELNENIELIGCGCASAERSAGWLAWAGVALVIGRRRGKGRQVRPASAPFQPTPPA